MTNFEAIRRRLQLSQAAIGKEIGVTQGNVSFYEKGQTVPPNVAARLIQAAGSRGVSITFNDIYSAPSKRRRASANKRGAAVPPVARESA